MHGAETLRSAPHTTEGEETIMLGNVIAAVKNTIVGWAHNVGTSGAAPESSTWPAAKEQHP